MPPHQHRHGGRLHAARAGAAEAPKGAGEEEGRHGSAPLHPDQAQPEGRARQAPAHHALRQGSFRDGSSPLRPARGGKGGAGAVQEPGAQLRQHPQAGGGAPPTEVVRLPQDAGALHPGAAAEDPGAPGRGGQVGQRAHVRRAGGRHAARQHGAHHRQRRRVRVRAHHHRHPPQRHAAAVGRGDGVQLSAQLLAQPEVHWHRQPGGGGGNQPQVCAGAADGSDRLPGGPGRLPEEKDARAAVQDDQAGQRGGDRGAHAHLPRLHHRPAQQDGDGDTHRGAGGALRP
mmetsp:Transcript_23291/g.58802  ORF Transcript_23291/g.58802 Transcript_23291/m.58802 type:complete len:286 (-) Transcript_23291:838-1695(-)